MGTRLLMYFAVLLAGILVGTRTGLSDKLKKRLGSIQTACLILLLVVMGVKIGMDEEVVNSFLQIGFSALVMSVFTISFSILAVMMVKQHVTGGGKE